MSRWISEDRDSGGTHLEGGGAASGIVTLALLALVGKTTLAEIHAAGRLHAICVRSAEEPMHPIHVLWMLVVGLIAGALAKLIMPGRDPGGIVVTMLLGIGGSVLAGCLGRAVGLYRNPGSGPGIIASVIGALIILGAYRLAIGRGVGRHDKRIGRPAV